MYMDNYLKESLASVCKNLPKMYFISKVALVSTFKHNTSRKHVYNFDPLKPSFI